MKLNRLFIYFSLLAIGVASCKKDNKNLGPTTGNGDTDTTKHTTPPPVLEPYTITEDFESGSKTGYDAGDVTTITGSWNLDGSLLGTDPSDTKDGTKSVRIQGTTGNTKRNGIVTMNFDIKHLTSISIKSALTNFADKARPAKNVNPPYLKGTWELQKSIDGGKNFIKIGSTVTCDTLLTATVFAITDTIPVRFRIVNTSDLNGSNKVRINIDDVVFSGKGDPGITVGDGSDPDTTGTSTPAGARNVTIGADAPPTSGDNSNLLMGNPSNAITSLATGDNYLIDQGYYTESYNATRGEPNWVSWHLDASNTTSGTSRLDNFAAWAGLSSTGFYAVQSNSYSGSGFDRGHNCPSADRVSSANANSATFLMTNMIPQAPENNEQTWNNMEGDLRTLVGQGNELYIIMGSYGTGGTGSKGLATVVNGNSHIAVPAHVWKVAIVLPVGDGDISRVTANTRVIAVDTPNDNSIDHDWTKYTTTIQAIEAATGYSLFSALPQNIKAALEAKTTTGI